ncbi:MAG: hypothetical protein IE933_14560 [Sphingomonadales bacterium]|nr:hypothetical protein [Sphingomonadales bacterium]MBD3775434.1 hypothetical protein [Paracoccaceae bacterium]
MSEHVALRPIREIYSSATLADDAPHTLAIEEFLDHIYAIDREVRWNERFGPGAAEPCHDGGQQHGAFIFDFGDIRSLLANWGYVQSAMSITEPNRLLLEYTQAMMGFLLFNGSPRTIEIIGLGGGSLAKYCHAYLPSTHIRAVEIDEHVLAMADQFCIPVDSSRLELVLADGHDFVARNERTTDVLLIDDFNNEEEVHQLNSAGFFSACRARLNPGGILVANLCDPRGQNRSALRNLRKSFDQIVTLPVEAGMNLVVFAFPEGCQQFDRKQLHDTARLIGSRHPLPMAELVERLQLRPGQLAGKGFSETEPSSLGTQRCWS